MESTERSRGRTGESENKDLNALFREEAQYRWAIELSNMRVLSLELGTFRTLHRSEAPCWATFWRLGRVWPTGDCRLRVLNRPGGGIGLESGYLESIEQSGPWKWQVLRLSVGSDRSQPRAQLDPDTRCKVYKGNGNLYPDLLARTCLALVPSA